MPPLQSGTDLARRAADLRRVIRDASRGLVERDALVELVALAAVAREHVLVIGPPGTAKSEAVRRIARGLGGRYFEYLVGRFTEPSEIFGPISLRKLKDGLVETETDGMLPEAELAFLDEVFQGSTAILNTLLGILNERMFVRGHSRRTCPLRVCVGAANVLPNDEVLAAFADRFLVRAFVEPVPEPQLEELLEAGWLRPALGAAGSISDLDALGEAVDRVDVEAARPHLADALRLLRGAGLTLSDRRAVRVQRLMAAAALLDGRTTAAPGDLWPIVFVVPTADGQKIARDVLRERLARSESGTLPAAALEASQGPRARAIRVIEAGRLLLGERPGAGDMDAQQVWRLRLESVAREIDSIFAPEELPEELKALRTDVATILAPGNTPQPASP
ncbi:MAG: AAA family ATPase [Deltaproteobacteria bacterium]|nr:AAA family ATPase [Deltaproteobacteria bacterium]